MYFDGASTQNSTSAGVVLISPSKENIHLSYKLDFKTTNNIAEYEALLLGVKAAKEMGIMCIHTFGDADLIIPQVNNTFQKKKYQAEGLQGRGMETQRIFMFLNCHIFLGI